MTDAEMAADIVDRLWPIMVKAITVMDMRGIKTPTTDGFGRTILEIDGNGAGLVSRNRNRFKHLDALAAVLKAGYDPNRVVCCAAVQASRRPCHTKSLCLFSLRSWPRAWCLPPAAG